MKVCIAEKPSVARDIARILGATSSKDGYMEGNGYQVTWTFGHLCELKEPNDYAVNWKHWSLAALPMVPARFGIKLIEDEGIKKQFAVIERLYKNAEEIINCGDAGQEGELIQRWVMQKANVKCPVKRLWISSMTDEAIKQGFASLKDQQQYEPLYLAGLSRAIGDWLLGMNATRLYTLKYGQNRQVLSIGRVQTPTLALIVNRQKEIDNFKPEPYWVLATIYRDVQFTATSGKFLSREEGEQAFATIEGKPMQITSVQKKKGTEAPPFLYDLTSLQVDCNRKFGYSAEDTLNLIQTLYERKFTTYPRVDTQYLSEDIYPKCPQILNGLSQSKIDSQPKYKAPIHQLAAISKQLPKSKKVFDSSKVTDHHAIIPTGVPVMGLTQREQNVFDLIAMRFISVFYPDCKFATTTVQGEVDGIAFKTSGKEILEPGWRALYQHADGKENSDGDTPETGVLPAFKKGESGPHTPTLTEKQTTPPKFYTEATLLRAMETAGKFVDDEELRLALKENGIGRPSSRASIIETLFKRHYIRRERIHRLTVTLAHDGLRREMKDDLRLGSLERPLECVEIPYVALDRVHCRGDAGGLKYLAPFLRRRRQGKTRHLRAKRLQEERKPHPLKAGMPRDEDAFPTIKSRTYLQSSHTFHGALPLFQSSSSSSFSRSVSMHCQNPSCL